MTQLPLERFRVFSGRFTPAARRRAARLLHRVRGRRPQVTAVVLLHDAEAAARAAVDAVRNQPLSTLDIVLVVLDARLGELAAVAERQDWRVRRVDLVDAGVAEARRAGARAARADWLIFLNARQVLLPGALEELLSARGTARSVVMGGLQGAAPEVWSATPLLGRLLVPAEAWSGAHDDGDPDGQTVAVDLAVSGHVTTETEVLRDLFVPRTRPFERAVDPMPDLEARVAADHAMLDLLGGADARLRTARAVGSLRRELPRFLFEAERADDSAWALLRDHCDLLCRAAGDSWTSALRTEERVATWLAARGMKDELVAFVAARRFAGGSFPTRARAGEILAVLDDLPSELPPEVLRLNIEETTLRAQVRSSRRRGDLLEVEVFAGITMLDQGHDVAEADAVLVAGDRRHELEVEVRADGAVTRWLAQPHQYHDFGALIVRVPLHLVTAGSWDLEVKLWSVGVRRQGLVRELDPHGSAAQKQTIEGRSLHWRRAHGRVRLVAGDAGAGSHDAAPAIVTGFSSGPGHFAIVLDAPAGSRASLVADGVEIVGTRQSHTWEFDLTSDPWGLGAMPLPGGTYRVRVVRDGTDLPVGLSADVIDALPWSEVDAVHRTSVWGVPDGGLELNLSAPLGDDELGPWAQRRMQQAATTSAQPLDRRLVYFQSFLGQAPTDHPAAIQAELHRVLRERAIEGVRMLWAVADSSVAVPEGAEPVLMRSRAWYDALAHAAWIVTNVELEPWFVRREGQEVLQTYHGYPAKAMGLSQWRGRDLTTSHQRQMLHRTSGTWNNLLTPIPEMDHHYRENYAFEGRIIAQGYPRDDALVSPGREVRRAATRRRLGIDQDQVAVLYAPTWRDDLATNFRRAEAQLHLDVEKAAADLGPGHVILLRGHRFHTLSSRGARVVDVTAYPEINDLILAADVAVLDYSSLRFDFALTGRPMIFLVPDLATYTGRTRGFLYDFSESAPGPQVETTREVVEAIRDLVGLQKRWARRIEEFNSMYNRLADGRAAQRVVAEFFAPLLDS